jgi:hypothetical protein
MRPDPIKSFLLKVLLWMPVCFAAWYYLRGVIGIPTYLGVKALMTALLPEVIHNIEFQGHLVNVVLRLTPEKMPDLQIPVGQVAEMVFSVNSLMYGYGIPLYTGLLLASPGSEREKWLRWLAGFLILMLAQVWGVSFDILKTLLFNLEPAISHSLGFSALQKELTVLAYQFGYLILPAVTPLVLWIGFHRAFIAELAPGLDDKFTRT